MASALTPCCHFQELSHFVAVLLQHGVLKQPCAKKGVDREVNDTSWKQPPNWPVIIFERGRSQGPWGSHHFLGSPRRSKGLSTKHALATRSEAPWEAYEETQQVSEENGEITLHSDWQCWGEARKEPLPGISRDIFVRYYEPLAGGDFKGDVPRDTWVVRAHSCP